MTSNSNDFFNALRVVVKEMDLDLPDHDIKEMLTLTKLYFENPIRFRGELSKEKYKGRNHLINTVRNGNVVWAKKVIELLDGYDNFVIESSQFMGKECYICYDSFEENHIVYKVPCNGHHIFHKHCIDKWVSINSTCPYCRDPISVENITGFLNKSSETGKNVLYYAIKLGNKSFVEDLLNKGALVQYNHATPLHLAAGFGKSDLIALCLAKGISIDATDERGRTPLYYAAKYAEPGILLSLLDQGANFEFQFYHHVSDALFETNALLVALYKDNLKSVPCLIDYCFQKGISLDSKDSNEHDALFYATKSTKSWEIDILKQLLDKGATMTPPSSSPDHPLLRCITYKPHDTLNEFVKKEKEMF